MSPADRPYGDDPVVLHRAFEMAAVRSPDSVALTQGDERLTFGELNERANRLAAHLEHLGVAADDRVAIHLPPGIDAVVGALAVLKSGGAYVPVDPSYPAVRVEQVLEDAAPRCLITTTSFVDSLPTTDARFVVLDADPSAIELQSGADVDRSVAPTSLAYVIFTSGSTGRPKGVMVEHGSLANFLAAMDERVPHDPPGRLLSVTSLAFDISVLEIFWTLIHGFEVVFEDDAAPPPVGAAASGRHPVSFSLCYFGSDRGAGAPDHVRLLLEGARFADRNGFEAVWTPERHFHDFGANHPNPSVTSAALATVTERIALRAGSVVLPLHHPARVAEEWALVDNLSGGRVGVSFAPGWQPSDFVLSPASFADRRRTMFDGIDTVRRLWRGESVAFRDPAGIDHEVSTRPRPVQPDLPTWVTAAGDPETFRAAGAIGANVLTHLLGQSVDELASKIDIYREAWREHGHGPGDGHVSLMVHTLVGPDAAATRALVREPMQDYVDSSLSMLGGTTEHWSTLKRRPDGTTAGDPDVADLDDEQRAALVGYSAERFVERSGLFGSPESCADQVARFGLAGVDEIACLIDFGLPTDVVLDSLVHLDDLRRRTQGVGRQTDGDRVGRIAELLAEHSITHLQCVPSMARALVEVDETRTSLRDLDVLLIGGERLTGDLALRLRAATSASVLNMYGPTETTIWSSTGEVGSTEGEPTIGHPVRNTSFHVLDERREPVPVGEEGELWIGGAGVARGYIGRPDLTAERFVVDPFDPRPGRRLYRTGDLVRQRPDGRFDIIGRTDHQVKVRGNRIELGEIEAVLHRHESVREAAVLAIDVSVRDRRLVGFVTARGSARPDADELRAALALALPRYMVPSQIAVIDAMPLTPNGKVDRTALIEHDRSARRGAAPNEPPNGAIEPTIAGIWEQVLDTGPVGPHDNFFDLGGHSLVAIEAHHLLERALGRKVAIGDLLRHPTVRLLAEHLATEPEHDGVSDCPTGTTARERVPLSFAQERLWLIDQLDPGSAAYHDGFTIDIDGLIDPEVLRGSFEALVERHEILRTAFDVTDGRPRQAVARSIELPWCELDLSGFAASERRQQLRQHAERLVDLPFDLATGPLIRASLVKLDHDEHVVVLVFHHAIIDGASLAPLLDELAATYAALALDERPELDPVRHHYGDFAVDERRAADLTDRSDGLAFWSDYLAGIQQPASAAIGAGTAHEAGRCSLTLDTATTNKIRQIARDAEATPFMVFLAVFGALLQRTTQADRVVIGSPFVERERFGALADVGLFLNVLPLRVDAAGRPTFAELLGRVRDDVLAAFDHHDVPFQQIVRHLGAHHDPIGSSLFEAIINYESLPPASATAGTTRFTVGWKPIGAARVPLELYVDDVGDRTTIRLLHSLDRFDGDAGRTLLDGLARLIEAVVDEPDTPIAHLSLVTETAQEFVPDLAVAATTEPFRAVADLVADQARRNPDRAAVVQEEMVWTYAQLDVRADAVTADIGLAGLGRGDVVAVCGTRSFELVATMLGVLRSGAVLLLLDPELPRARLDQMSRDADVELTIELDDAQPWAFRADGDDSTPIDPPDVDGDDPAYVFFTSGSTGRPKAVLGRHRGLSHFVQWQRDTFGIGAGDRSAQLTALSFDVVLRDVFTPLVAGAELHLVPPGRRLIGEDVLPWLSACRITMLHTVPSLASFWVRDSPDVALSSLRLVFFAGEPLHDTVVERWRRLVAADAALVNLYGPTETTLATCSYVVPAEPVPGIQPVGRPIPGTEVWVSHDDLLHPCGIGEPGEIVVRSPYRSLGYLHDPACASSGFVHNPSAADEDDLIYRTGDIGVLAPDGAISYLGRFDDQVKIRGQRVEPGEIEASLLRHPDVAECVVVHHGEADAMQLVAYIGTTAGARPAAVDLRRHLAGLLPSGAVPGRFVVANELPRLATGKVDRQALSVAPPPDGDPDDETSDEVATALERRLGEIWSAVLDRPDVGRHDDFFAIGGHSLLALELAARIEHELGSAFPVSMLLSAPTIELQARAMSATARPADVDRPPAARPGTKQFFVAGRDDGIIPLSTSDSGDRLPLLLIPGTGEHPIRFRHLTDTLEGDRPVFGAVHLLLPASDPEPSIEVIAASIRFELDRHGLAGPMCVGGYSSGAVIAYELAQQLTADGIEVAALVLIDPSIPTSIAPRFTTARRRSRRVLQLLRREVPARTATESIGRWWNDRRGRLSGQPVTYGDTTPSELALMDRAHRRAARRYAAKPFQGVVSVIRRDLDERWYSDAISSWLRLGSAGSSVRAVQGEHVELLTPPSASDVAGHVTAWLRAADAAHGLDDLRH